MVQIQLRRGDSTSWAESNPVLAPGEAAVETDTGRMKVGDGLLPWTDLDYFPSSVDSDQVIGSIPPSQVTGTAVVQSRVVGSGTGLVGGGDLSTDRTLGIAAGGVGTTQLADDAVNAAKIAAGAVGNAEVASGAGIDPSKIAGSALVQSTATTKGDLLVRGTSAVERLAAGVAGTNPILVPDTAASGGLRWGTWADADVARASQVGNLLPVNVATGSDTLGTATDWVSAGGISGSIASTTAQARRGSRSVTWTASGTGNIFAVAAKSVFTGSAANGHSQVTPGETLTVLASLRATAAETVIVRVYWYKSDGTASATTSTNAITVTLSTSSWLDVAPPVTVPSDATWAGIVIFRSAGAVGTVFYADSLSLHRGTGGVWQAPGVPITGLIAAPLALPSTSTLNRAQPVVVNPSGGGAKTWTLPAAADNYGVQFTLINDDTATVTIGRSGSDTVSGQAFNPTIPGKGNLVTISTGTTWLVLSGKHTTSTVGLASYEWNPTANSTTASAWWRLIAYDSGVRNVASLLTNGWAEAGSGPVVELRRQNGLVTLTGGIDGSAKTADTFLATPDGFKPLGFRAMAWVGHNSVNAAVYGDVSSDNVRCFSGIALVRFTAVWTAAAALPTSLPGTQVIAPV